jgi:poly-gamma-glutamate capsule biosynthesis protein CapA/YwtB (metallophosphatase superfamily)
MIKKIITFVMVLMLSFSGNASSSFPRPTSNPDKKQTEIINEIKETPTEIFETSQIEHKPKDKSEVKSEQQYNEEPMDYNNSEQDVSEKDGEEVEDEIEILISFAGDCTIGTDESFSYVNSFPYRFEKVGKDYSYFFKAVQSVFQNDDLTLVNLETTFTNAKKKAQKAFRFKGDPSYVNILTEGSIEMVNISNNHIYDYLSQGFNETLDMLTSAGVLYSGEGHIAYYETKGITIASIGYNGWSTRIMESLSKDIEAARSEADIVIVSFHWGKERSYYPNAVQITLGRYAIDEGADIVVGHHPHVIQGIDKYKDKYIVYSLGNFCFGGNRNPTDKDTFIFQNHFIFREGKLSDSKGIVYTCSISSVHYVNDFQPTLLNGKDRERVIERILQYSSKLKYGVTEDDVEFYDPPDQSDT